MNYPETAAMPVIRQALKSAKAAAKKRGANATYMEQAEAVLVALNEADFVLWGPPRGGDRVDL